LAADGTPYLFWDDKWYPICGHYFWNDNHGVDAFCRELGFSSGTRRISNSNYGEDAIKIGSCKAGEDIASCTGNKTSTEWTPTADLVREIMLLLLHVLEILRALKKIAAQIFLLLPFLKQQRRRAHVMEIYRLAIGVVIKLFLSLQRQITLNAE